MTHKRERGSHASGANCATAPFCGHSLKTDRPLLLIRPKPLRAPNHPKPHSVRYPKWTLSHPFYLRQGSEAGRLLPSEGFQRFSVSHELGHYFLEGHIDQLLKTGVHVSRAGFVTADPYELEADHFAAGLLMPETPFRKEMENYEPGLVAVDALATRCITSRTATAICYAELTRDAVSVIVSTGGVIDYCFMSDTMKTLPKIARLRKGTKLPASTVTARLADAPDQVRAGATVFDETDVRDLLSGTTKLERDYF